MSQSLLKNGMLPQRGKIPTYSSTYVRPAYIKILAFIHEAGIAHGNIRSWDLLEDDKGGCFIVDFDRAKLRGSRYQMVAEQDRLRLLLDGENIGDYSVTSYPAST